MVYTPLVDSNRVTAADLDSNIPVLLASVTLTVALANVIVAVPTGWNRLKAYYSGTCSGAVASSTAKVQFNGDTGNNYTWIYTQSNNGTTSTTQNATQSAIQIGTITGATSTANYSGSGTLIIDNVAGSTFYPIVVSTSTTFVTTANMFNGVYSGQWTSLTAISSINFVLGSGNWTAGSAFSLYGLPS